MSVVGLSLSACILCVAGLLLNYLTKNLLGYSCYQKIFDQIQMRNINGMLKKYWKTVVTNTSSNRSSKHLFSAQSLVVLVLPDLTQQCEFSTAYWFELFWKHSFWPHLPKMLCNVSATLGLLLVATGLLLLFLHIVSFLLAALFTFLKLYLTQTQKKTSSTPPSQIPEKTHVKYK